MLMQKVTTNLPLDKMRALNNVQKLHAKTLSKRAIIAHIFFSAHEVFFLVMRIVPFYPELLWNTIG